MYHNFCIHSYISGYIGCFHVLAIVRSAAMNTGVHVNKRIRNAVLGYNLKNDRMISVRFQSKPFNITVNKVYAPITNTEDDEAEWFYEDLQDLLELTHKDALFITGDWNARVVSQEILGVTGKFGLGVQNEAGQRLMEFCPENALVIANTLFPQRKR